MKAALVVHDYDATRNLLHTVDPNMMVDNLSILRFTITHRYPYDIVETLLKWEQMLYSIIWC